MRAIVRELAPDAIIHQATALTGLGNNLRRFDQSFATADRLRVEGTRTLIEAGRELPTQPRLVAQSFCGWPWAPEGGGVKSEEDRLDPNPARAFRRTFAALTELESLVTGYEQGVVCATARSTVPARRWARAATRSRQSANAPVRSSVKPVRCGPSLHVEDAAGAAVAALNGGSDVYNIADDRPVRIGDWLVEIVSILGAPSPRRVRVWLARLAGGSGLVHMMTSARGSSNAKAKAGLGWQPAHPDWRPGFEELLGATHNGRALR